MAEMKLADVPQELRPTKKRGKQRVSASRITSDPTHTNLNPLENR